MVGWALWIGCRAPSAHPAPAAALEAAASEVPRCGPELAAFTADWNVAVTGSGRHLYVVGGDGPSDRAARFDVRTRSWEALPELPVRRHRAGIAAAAGQIVVAGTSAPAERGDAMIHLFDPDTCSWAVGPTWPWAGSSPAATAVGARVYVFGGDVWFETPAGDVDAQSVAELASFEVGSLEVTRHPPAAVPRAQAGAAVVGGGLWVIAGERVRPYDPNDTDGQWEQIPNAERFDLVAGTWSTPARFAYQKRAVSLAVGDSVLSFAVDPLDRQVGAWFDVEAGAFAGESPDPGPLGEVVGAAVVEGRVTALVLGEEGTSVAALDLEAGAWVPLHPGRGR